VIGDEGVDNNTNFTPSQVFFIDSIVEAYDSTRNLPAILNLKSSRRFKRQPGVGMKTGSHSFPIFL